MKTIVIALGGNAIAGRDYSAAAQQAAVRSTINKLWPVFASQNHFVLVHGNGPQVGNLLLQQAAGATETNPAMPLDTAGAMTEGSIGYWLQQAIDETMLAHHDTRRAATVITQTLVDSADPAFKHPTKPIGPFYNEQEISRQRQLHPEQTFKADAGRGYRRVVASPAPVKILEAGVINQLAMSGQIPVVAGGGGIPVCQDQNGQLVGQAAVIDKDLAAAKVAADLDADELIILTAVPNVYLHFNSKQQTALTTVDADQMEAYLQAGEFAAGSMAPKVQACLNFVKQTGHPAKIAALADAGRLDQVGTNIIPCKK
ncbi:MAG: carbamate kinase [Lactobacillus sp.]|jgi:carbamate kinase|nr:carbamate kinase [Lactobacillus sp.]MCH3906042.1 carbamate kinase [Lactobacillus sp.]MCH3990384.1 carbamate kinase [Lactobacillus sp.]MCH4068901.1 carbamate kinase [Lactobacillus sp.]MCI1303303.1 carbamate kinase [Lactobacillus sp.]